MQLVVFIRNQQFLNLSLHPIELIFLLILALILVWIEARPPHESFPGWPRRLGRHERNIDVLAAWISRHKQTPAQAQVNPVDPIIPKPKQTSHGQHHSKTASLHSSQKNDRTVEDQAKPKTTKNHTDQAASKDTPTWGFTTWGINATGFEDSLNSGDNLASDQAIRALSDSGDSVDGVSLFPCKGVTEIPRGRPVQRSLSVHADIPQWSGVADSSVQEDGKQEDHNDGSE